VDEDAINAALVEAINEKISSKATIIKQYKAIIKMLTNCIEKGFLNVMRISYLELAFQKKNRLWMSRKSNMVFNILK
jgi:hypothetical protein